MSNGLHRDTETHECYLRLKGQCFYWLLGTVVIVHKNDCYWKISMKNISVIG